MKTWSDSALKCAVLALQSLCQTCYIPQLFQAELRLPLFMGFAAISSIGAFSQMFMLSPLDALCSYHFPFISMLTEISSHHCFRLFRAFLGHFFLEG